MYTKTVAVTGYSSLRRQCKFGPHFLLIVVSDPFGLFNVKTKGVLSAPVDLSSWAMVVGTSEILLPACVFLGLDALNKSAIMFVYSVGKSVKLILTVISRNWKGWSYSGRRPHRGNASSSQHRKTGI